jgi:hypothetical protein
MANLKHGGDRKPVEIKLPNGNLIEKPMITLTAAAKAVGVSTKKRKDIYILPKKSH